MYKLIARKLTTIFIFNQLINEDKKEIYEYGFEILVSTVAYAFIFLLCAFITSTFWTSIFFFLGFYLIRKFCGGFHADTYIKCHIMSALNHVLVIIILKLLPPTYYQFSINTILLFCCALIFLAAPVDHKDKRFVKNERQRFRIKSCIYGCFIILILVINILGIINLANFDIYVFAYSLGSLSATISMLSAKLINFYERSKPQ